MGRGIGRVAGVAALAVLAVIVTGCAGWWPSDDSGRLRDGIEELAEVPGPDGETPVEVNVLGCDDRAEMPMAVAQLRLDEPVLGGADARNAAAEDLGAWYLPRWEVLGWEVEPGEGSATKVFDGRRLRATVDGLTEDHYSVVVWRDGGLLCT